MVEVPSSLPGPWPMADSYSGSTGSRPRRSSSATSDSAASFAFSASFVSSAPAAISSSTLATSARLAYAWGTALPLPSCRRGAVTTRRCGHRPGSPGRRLRRRTSPRFARLCRRHHRLGAAGPTHLVPRRAHAGGAVRTCGDDEANDAFWAGQAGAVWSFMVRPVAVGGMLVGACFTLFRMRKSLYGQSAWRAPYPT